MFMSAFISILEIWPRFCVQVTQPHVMACPLTPLDAQRMCRVMPTVGEISAGMCVSVKINVNLNSLGCWSMWLRSQHFVLTLKTNTCSRCFLGVSLVC